MRGRAAVIVFGAAAAFLAAAPGASAYIYWANYGPGLGGTGTTINRSNLDAHGQKGGFITTPSSSPASIVSDGTHVYWGNTTGGPPAIGRANVDGSGANDTFMSAKAFGISVTSSYIYWTDGSRYIGRANLNGTGVDPQFIDMGNSQAPFGIAASGNKLYVGRAGQIVTVPATKSANPTITPFATLANASAYPFSVSVSNGYVYWAEVNLGAPSGSSSIAREATTGTGFNENYVSGLQEPTGVANDGSWVYWVDHTTGSIGRAHDNDTSATDIQASFITDPGGPWGVAVDALIDPTGTTVSCTPSTVAQGNPSVCTATVSDSASSETPGGTVTFSGSASTFFPGGNTCTLGPLPGGGGSSCTVGAQTATTGQQSVGAAYPGDPSHSPSNGSGQYCVGDSTVCGGGSGGGGGGGAGGTGGTPGGGTPGSPGGAPGPKVVCKVPKLKGKTLAQARKLLTRAHCRLGKVKRPHAPKRRALVVGKQTPAAGRSMSNGAKVALKLVFKPRTRHR